jgi:four helix bundle protein
VKKIFRLCRKLPKNRETDIISRQLIEAGTSIPANVAEGYGGHLGKGFAKYLEIARGSTTETDYWTYMLYDEKYISKDEYEDATKDCRELILMTNSMVNRIRGKVKS